MKKKTYAVVIPSNRVFDSIQPLLVSLAAQTLPPHQIVIVWDRYASKSEVDTYIISTKLLFAQLEHIRIDIIHSSNHKKFAIGKGASYVRNYGRSQVKQPYMMFIDDDNVCPDDMCENLFGFVEHQIHPENTIVAPLQYDDHQNTIRSALAKGFNFALSRPIWLGDEIIQSSDRYAPLQLASSNCLAGPTALFASYPFPEEVPFVYEDLIMVAQMWKGGVEIFVDSWASVLHRHAHRSRLSELYINTSERAYRKAKHRIILVHTLGTPREKILFSISGFIGQLGRFALHIMYYAPMAQWTELFGALYEGTRDGIKTVKKKN